MKILLLYVIFLWKSMVIFQSYVSLPGQPPSDNLQFAIQNGPFSSLIYLIIKDDDLP